MDEYNVIHIPREKLLVPYEWNARKTFLPKDVQDLVISIARDGLQFHGIARPRNEAGYEYELVAGFRRYMALCVILDRPTYPCRVKDMDDEEAKRINFIENVERKDLSPLQEAIWIQTHWPDKSATWIAAYFGKCKDWAEKRVLLIQQPEEIQDMLAAGRIGLNDVHQFISIAGSDKEKLKVARELELQNKLPPGQRGKDRFPRRHSGRTRPTNTQIGKLIDRLSRLDTDRKLNKKTIDKIILGMRYAAGSISEDEFWMYLRK